MAAAPLAQAGTNSPASTVIPQSDDDLFSLTRRLATAAGVVGGKVLNADFNTVICRFTITNQPGDTTLVAGDALCPGIEVTNALAVNANGTLNGVFIFSHTNITAQSIGLLITKIPLVVAPTYSSPFTLSPQDGTNILACIDMSTARAERLPIGATNQAFWRGGLGIGISSWSTNAISGTNGSIFVYPFAQAAVTNSGNDEVKLTIIQDKLQR